MSILNSTRVIIELAEKLSGRPVRIKEDPTLGVLATMKMARGEAPMHMISYRPIQGRQPDYHICFQCGFIIRLFETSSSERYDFSLAEKASAEMDEILSESSFPPEMRQMKGVLIDGLLTQLRSVPIGLRIDEWLWSQYPELREEQIASARLQLQQNVSALHPSVSKQFPKKIVAANTAMNSAYACFWADKFSDDWIILPYRSIGKELAGRELIDLFVELNSSPFNDRDLVDRWGERLGLQGWYRWIPYNLYN